MILAVGSIRVDEIPQRVQASITSLAVFEMFPPSGGMSPVSMEPKGNRHERSGNESSPQSIESEKDGYEHGRSHSNISWPATSGSADLALGSYAGEDLSDDLESNNGVDNTFRSSWSVL